MGQKKSPKIQWRNKWGAGNTAGDPLVLDENGQPVPPVERRIIFGGPPSIIRQDPPRKTAAGELPQKAAERRHHTSADTSIRQARERAALKPVGQRRVQPPHRPLRSPSDRGPKSPLLGNSWRRRTPESPSLARTRVVRRRKRDPSTSPECEVVPAPVASTSAAVASTSTGLAGAAPAGRAYTLKCLNCEAETRVTAVEVDKQ
ncbi:hypothetical protein C8R46DRAFT_1226441 [Mycena filopes]|nr:hypothetical protein C8R46DRAFT_1226441 [Mycena filopes]